MKSRNVLVAGSVVLLGIVAASYWRTAPSSSVAPESPALATRHGQDPGSRASVGSTQMRDLSTDSESQAQDLTRNGQRFSSIVSSGGAIVNKAIDELLPLWVAENPLQALRYSDSLPAGPLRDSIQHRMLQCWAERARSAALAWVDARPLDERQPLILSICKQVAGTDSRAAVLLAQDRGLSKGNPEFVAYLVGQWAEHDPAPALAWARGQRDQKTRDLLLTHVAVARAGKASYQDAIYLALDEISEAAAQEDAIAMIVNQWAVKDLKTATGWVDENFALDDPLRGRAFSELEAAKRGQLMLQALK